MKIALPVLVAIAAACVWYFLRSDPAPPRDPVQRDVVDATLVAPAPELRADELPPVDDAPRRDVAPALPQEAAPLGATEERRAPDARAVRVRVLDRERTPLGDMRVVVSMDWPRHPTAIASATTGADGEARIAWDLVRGTNQSLAASVEGPFDPSHAVFFPLSEPPEHVIELVVDPGGALEVLVRDGAGRPVPGAQVRVAHREMLEANPAWYRSDRPAWSAAQETGGTGIARFEPVGAGVALAVQVREPHGVEAVRARAVGPPRGDTLRVEIAFDPDDVVWTGEVVGAAGGVTGGNWSVHYFGERAPWIPHPWHYQSAPDERTPFRLRIDAGAARALDPSTWLVFVDGSCPAAFFELRDRLTPGEHDLGAVHSPRGRALFAGHARYESGEPFGHDFEIDARTSGGRWWPLPMGIGFRSDSSGAFRIDGAAEPSLEWRVRPSVHTVELVSPQSVEPGSEALEIVVRSTQAEVPKLTGRVVMGEGGPFHPHLEARLRTRGKSSPMRAPIGPDGTFALRASGTEGDLEIGVRWHDAPLARVVGAVGPDGGVPEAPFVFDLSGRIALARLSARGPRGEPVAIRLRPAGGVASPVSWPIQDGTRIVVHDTPLEVFATAPGLREVRVTLVPGDNEVRFPSAALPVRLSWSGAPRLPPDRRLRPVLVPAEELREPWDAHAVTFDDDSFDDDGVVRTGVPRPGRYVVLLQLAKITPNSRSYAIFVGADTPPEILVEDGADDVVFPVHWDAARVLDEHVKRLP